MNISIDVWSVFKDWWKKKIITNFIDQNARLFIQDILVIYAHAHVSKFDLLRWVRGNLLDTMCTFVIHLLINDDKEETDKWRSNFSICSNETRRSRSNWSKMFFVLVMEIIQIISQISTLVNWTARFGNVLTYCCSNNNRFLFARGDGISSFTGSICFPPFHLLIRASRQIASSFDWKHLPRKNVN